jgi:hypothetical protein
VGRAQVGGVKVSAALGDGDDVIDAVGASMSAQPANVAGVEHLAPHLLPAVTVLRLSHDGLLAQLR